MASPAALHQKRADAGFRSPSRRRTLRRRLWPAMPPSPSNPTMLRQAPIQPTLQRHLLPFRRPVPLGRSLTQRHAVQALFRRSQAHEGKGDMDSAFRDMATASKFEPQVGRAHTHAHTHLSPPPHTHTYTHTRVLPWSPLTRSWSILLHRTARADCICTPLS
jgi:hypothetical protein